MLEPVLLCQKHTLIPHITWPFSQLHARKAVAECQESLALIFLQRQLQTVLTVEDCHGSFRIARPPSLQQFSTYIQIANVTRPAIYKNKYFTCYIRLKPLKYKLYL